MAAASLCSMYCYHCCHRIDGEIVRLPLSCEKGQYQYYGYFCSFECMKTYNLDMNDSFVHKRDVLVSRLYSSLSGNIARQVAFAPPRDRLKIFGGSLEIEEFRGTFTKTPYMDIGSIEPKPQQVDHQTKERQPYEYRSAPVTNEPIKLKRSKPLKNSQNTLEASMGLFKTDS